MAGCGLSPGRNEVRVWSSRIGSLVPLHCQAKAFLVSRGEMPRHRVLLCEGEEAKVIVGIGAVRDNCRWACGTHRDENCARRDCAMRKVGHQFLHGEGRAKHRSSNTTRLKEDEALWRRILKNVMNASIHPAPARFRREPLTAARHARARERLRRSSVCAVIRRAKEASTNRDRCA